MFGVIPFAAAPFASYSYGYRSIAEGTGAWESTLTINGLGGQSKSGIGTISATANFLGLGSKVLGGNGSFSSTLNILAQGNVTIGGDGNFGGSTLNFLGVGALYEMPHDPEDYRKIKVGFRLYEWRPELGRWRPAGWAPGYEPVE